MYKVIYNNKIIDIIEKPDFIMFLASGRVVSTNKGTANGIRGSRGSLYSFEEVNKSGIKVVTIEEISAEEFNRLQCLLNSEKGLCADESVLKNVRVEELSRLSKACNESIVHGFDISLSDNCNYHFTLTTEDQINLLNLENQLKAGAETCIYHASNMPCTVFSRQDIDRIIAAYRKHLLYHTTYFNTVKSYINSIDDIDQIKAFKYGTNIASAASSTVIKQILKEGE